MSHQKKWPLRMKFRFFLVSLHGKESNQVMDVLNDIYAAIAAEGFTAEILQMIDNYAKDMQKWEKRFS